MRFWGQNWLYLVLKKEVDDLMKEKIKQCQKPKYW